MELDGVKVSPPATKGKNIVLEKEGRNLGNDQKDLDGSRVVSIDALRGFDMFWIIGGGEVLSSLAEVWKHPGTQTIQCQLSHVEWEGFHFEDLIFPLFVFIVGAVLAFSVSRRLERQCDVVKWITGHSPEMPESQKR